MVKIGIIVGSTRPGRFGIQPATWVHTLAGQRGDAEYVLVDIESFGLPLLDEPVPPLMHQYSKDHTKRWAEQIAGLDGFVVVTAEYNHSVPGALKNAFDFLFHEWNYKPVGFVSYGSAAGGARAVEHLRGIAGEVKMYDVRDQVLLPSYYMQLDEGGQYAFTEDEVTAANLMLEQVVVWAEAMAPVRAKLQAAAA